MPGRSLEVCVGPAQPQAGGILTLLQEGPSPSSLTTPPGQVRSGLASEMLLAAPGGKSGCESKELAAPSQRHSLPRRVPRSSTLGLVSAGMELIFPLASWSSAVFWIQHGIWHERNADNRLLFSVVAKESRTSQAPKPCQSAGASGAGWEWALKQPMPTSVSGTSSSLQNTVGGCKSPAGHPWGRAHATRFGH